MLTLTASDYTNLIMRSIKFILVEYSVHVQWLGMRDAPPACVQKFNTKVGNY